MRSAWESAAATSMAARAIPQALLEERLASLEGAEAAVVTASGMAAISATLFSLLQSGDEIVVDQIVYGTATLFTQGLARFGVRAVFADFTRPETVAAAIGPKTRPCISRRRPIPTCGWSTSRRCRPSRAARDC